MTTRPPIAILGFRLESNFHAPVIFEDEFVSLSGDALVKDLATDAPRAPSEVTGFMNVMEAAGERCVPLSLTSGGAAGEVDEAYFKAWVEEAVGMLKALGPVAGVYLPQHGAASATHTEDPDGELFARVRGVVGPDVPIVVSLDPHANVSAKMVGEIDALIAYRTNPHTDQRERGEEAAALMRTLLGGTKTALAIVKLPIIPPSISQNTKDGPLGEHIAYGQSFVGDDVLAVCVCSGFSLGDTVKAGMSVTVTVRGDKAKAEEVAQKIAARIWEERRRYDITMTSLAEAVAMMRGLNEDSNRPSLCFADVADNPGSGARGNTTHILRAFLDAGCKDVALAPFYDAPLAHEAAALGVGARFTAHFNREEPSEFSEELQTEAEVVALHTGEIVGRRGIIAGRRFDLGTVALIRCDGILVVVNDRRIQFCDPGILECVGLIMGGPRALIVKSRGHFRASVDEVFTDERIIEVDVPGLATPMLERIRWQRTPRPIYPLDRDFSWTPQSAP